VSEQLGRFGERLRQAREAAGVGRTELARRVDLNQSYLYRLEVGGRRPSRKTVVALAKALRLGAAETEAWLGAAGHDVTHLTGGARAASARGVRPAIPTSGGTLADDRNIFEIGTASQLEAGFAALGVDVRTMHRLLDAADSLSGIERRRLAEQVTGAFTRLTTAVSTPVQSVLIPVTHPRLGLLASHVVQLLVVKAIQEAVLAGAGRAILVASEGAVAPWQRSLVVALGTASVPRIDLAVVEEGTPVRGGGLGDAILRAEGEISDRPFGVLEPEATLASRPARAGPADSAFVHLAKVFGQLRTASDAYLIAVSGRSEGASSTLTVVTGEEVLPGVYRVTGLQSQPRLVRSSVRHGRTVLRATHSAAGRYLFGPGVVDALHETATDAGGEPSLADALEHLRRGGSDVYAAVLPGTQRPATARLDEVYALFEEEIPRSLG
jgi:DNA-binding XRE family transcriptional regulator